jgi:hypothetical protein
MAGGDECSSRTTAHSGTERQIHVFVVVSTIFKMLCEPSVLPELIYIKCRICKYRYMPDRLRRFKAEFFQALAHPTRIAILEQLHDGELVAGAIIERLGMEQANVSHTLLFSGQNKS